jgi:hypothetical protein
MPIKAVCTNDCYIKVGKSIRSTFYQRGQVVTFDVKEVPDHFVLLSREADPQEEDDGTAELIQLANTVTSVSAPIVAAEGAAFSFDEASEEMLLAAEYKITDLIAHCKAKYKLNLPKSAHKTVIVAKFIDARYRASVTDAGLQNAHMNLVEGNK